MQACLTWQARCPQRRFDRRFLMRSSRIPPTRSVVIRQARSGPPDHVALRLPRSQPTELINWWSDWLPSLSR